MFYMVGGFCFYIMKLVFIDGFEEFVIVIFLKEVLKVFDYFYCYGYIYRDVKVIN